MLENLDRKVDYLDRKVDYLYRKQLPVKRSRGDETKKKYKQ